MQNINTINFNEVQIQHTLTGWFICHLTLGRLHCAAVNPATREATWMRSAKFDGQTGVGDFGGVLAAIRCARSSDPKIEITLDAKARKALLVELSTETY
jgi:hypothetical protein